MARKARNMTGCVPKCEMFRRPFVLQDKIVVKNGGDWRIPTFDQLRVLLAVD